MRVNESYLRDILRLFVWFPFRWIVRIMPVDLSFFFFKVMGDLHFLAGRQKKTKLLQVIESQLKLNGNAFKILKKYYENHYLDRLHIFLYPGLNNRKRIEKYVVFENLEVLEKQLSEGRGVLLAQPHFGPVQITLLWLALYGYSPIQIGYPSDKSLSKIGRSVAFKYRLKYEQMIPAPIISADGYLGKAYKHLLKGGVVLTTGDGAGGDLYFGEQKVFDFLGGKRKVPLGPAAWSIKTNAAYIPIFIIPESYKRFRIVFEKPIEGIHNNINQNKVYLTEKFINLTECYIRRHPYCWHFWDEI